MHRSALTAQIFLGLPFTLRSFSVLPYEQSHMHVVEKEHSSFHNLLPLVLYATANCPRDATDKCVEALYANQKTKLTCRHSLIIQISPLNLIKPIYLSRSES